MKIGSIQRYKNYRQKHSLAIKLAGLILLASSIVTLFAVILLLVKQYYDDVDHLEEMLGQIKISALPSIARSLWYYDVDQIQFQVDSLLDVADIVGAEVVWTDKEGNERNIVAIGENRPVVRELFTRKFPLVYVPPSGDEHVLGDLNITVDLSGIYKEVFKQGGFIVLFQFSKTLVIAVIILWLVRTLISNHMKSIARYAEKLNLNSLNKKLALRRDKKTGEDSDELDNIVNAINKMRIQLLADVDFKIKIQDELSTAREEKYEQRKQADIAKEASRAKSLFLASMSHEIRTPMNGVVGMLDLLGQSDLTPEQKSYFNIAKSSTQNLLAIINDILDFSKIEAGKLYLEFHSSDIVADISDVALSFSGVLKREVELIVDLQIPDQLWVEVDSVRLKQVLSNLISNGLKFTNYGEVILRVTQRVGSNLEWGNNKVLLFEIIDSGCGIQKQKQETIFNSFAQADQSIQRSYGGTGLGLAICKSLLEMMGGTIQVESSPDHGARFYFELAFKAVNTEKVVDFKFEGVRGIHVLAFAHNEMACNAIVNTLRRWELKVDTVAEKNALDWYSGYSRENYDVIIYDVDNSVPYSDFLKFCRSSTRYRETSVVLVSRAGATVQADNNTFVVFKPLVPDTFKKTLISAVSKNRELPSRRDNPESTEGITSGVKVLVAEDNKINCMVITKMLNKLAIEPLICNDGEQALLKYQSMYNDIEIILMDCEMPNMDGIEATRRIRQFEQERRLTPVYIVALTAHALQENKNEAIAAGMDDYLSKPVTMGALRDLMVQISQRRSSVQSYISTINRL
jgi:signal transduction histidine kinase/CheY-like chemotaxis protein